MIDNNECNSDNNNVMETMMMFGQVIHPPGALSQPKMTGGTKAVTDFSPYITLAAAFCKSVLISVYFCTQENLFQIILLYL